MLHMAYAVRKFYTFLVDVFDYYCTVGTGDAFSVQFNAFMEFAETSKMLTVCGAGQWWTRVEGLTLVVACLLLVACCTTTGW